MAAMVSDLDIYRSAKLLIDQHGEDAGLEAAMRADDMLEKGAMAGAATWRRIVKAVEKNYSGGNGDRENGRIRGAPKA